MKVMITTPLRSSCSCFSFSVFFPGKEQIQTSLHVDGVEQKIPRGNGHVATQKKRVIRILVFVVV